MAIRSCSAKPLLALVLLTVLGAGIVRAGIDISNVNVNDLQQQLPPELANTNLTMDDAKKLVREKCISVGGEVDGEAAYNEIEAAVATLGECVSGIVNYTAIQAEIEQASPRGELDVVFNKYCLKRPDAIECVEKFNDALVPCLDKDERENQVVFMRIVRSLLNFVCHKGGDQIALFIAEKGPECLEDKRDNIQQCINSTFSGYLPKDGTGLESVKTLPKFVMGPKQCDEMKILEDCVVEHLETCDEITPANIVESMFRFIRNETICRDSPSAASAKQSGATSGVAAVGYSLGNVSVLVLSAAAFLATIKRLES